MGWILPKVNWLPSDGIANGDLNRIEGNTAELNQSKLGINGTAVNADKLNNMSRRGQNGAGFWNSIPYVGTDGNMSIGKQLDFQGATGGSYTGGVKTEGNKLQHIETDGSARDVYTTGNKPRASDVLGGTFPEDMTFAKYLQLQAWSGYGTGYCKFWFDNRNSQKYLMLEDVKHIGLRAPEFGDGIKWVYHEANKPTASDVKAFPLTGGHWIDSWIGASNFTVRNGQGYRFEQHTDDAILYLQARAGGSLGWHAATTGGTYVNMYAAGFHNYSDKRLKEEVSVPQFKKGILDMIMEVPTKYYTAKHDKAITKRVYHGLYAQDLEAAGLTYAVSTDDRTPPSAETEAISDTKIVDQYGLTTYLWDAVRELTKLVKTQQQTLDTIITQTLK